MTYELFKYNKIDKNFIDSLSRGYIYCAKPDSLNDPFDCKIDLPASISRAIIASSGDAANNLQKLKDSHDFITFVKEVTSEIGVCSFSRKLLKPVMWSHYADEHKGICCMYAMPEDFIDYDKNNIIGITDLSYGENILTEALVKIAPKLSSMNNSEIFKEITIPIFSSKGGDWDTEEEIRIIKSSYGELAINKKYLKQVCFGLHTPERDKKLIRGILNEFSYKPEFCEIIKSDTDFGLNVIDL